MDNQLSKEITQSLSTYLNENGISITKEAEQQYIKAVEGTLNFCHLIKWNSPNKHVVLANTPHQILESMKLRHFVYECEGVVNYFHPTIPGLLFDQYDQNSVTVNYLKEGKYVIGSIRCSFETGHGLPYQDSCERSQITQDSRTLELNRHVIHPKHCGNMVFPSFF